MQLPEPQPIVESDAPATHPVELAYKRWWVDQTPENLNTVVKELAPVVSYKMVSMGVADNPSMKHQAKLYAADAVRKFDPMSGANLQTWTRSQLQSMHRFKRENQGPIKIPDRAALDAWTLEKSSRDYIDKHGVEPDTKELADHSGISVKRIAAVRKATRPIAADSQMYDDGQTPVDFLGEALDYVYDDADRIDRMIIEHTTGYGGRQALPKNEVARILGISPAQVTRRAQRISDAVQQMEAGLHQTHA